MRYAVYMVVVEDTEANDLSVMANAEEGDRIAGNLTSDEASALLRESHDLSGANFDVYFGSDDD